MASLLPIQEAADVVVWGGGTGAVAAAIQAARGGARTLLLTPGSWLGGMVSAAGVCAPDGNELSPWQTGLWGAFLRELQRREPEGLDHNWVSCFGFRPATAESILRRWCAAEPLLQWWPMVQLRAVHCRGARVTGVGLLRAGLGIEVALQVLIDGSDRGDSWPLLDAPYRFGWEAKERWGEPSAPSQASLSSNPFYGEQVVQSPTWVVMGQLRSEAMPEACPTRAASLPPPFARAAERFGLGRTITYGRLPGGLVMLNWPLDGNDWHGCLDALFDQEPQVRAGVYAQMQAHSLAFAHALQEASAGWLALGACFPDPLAEAGVSGLAGPAPLALMPYWREGRRLVGEICVKEQDLLPQKPGACIAPLAKSADGALSCIAIGNYANDHHYPGDDYPLAAKSTRWGGRWSGTPFTIPYGALVSAKYENLLAADKCFSTSHIANGATRLQPLILNIGQASGAAAALAVAKNIAPAQLPVRELQEALIGDRQAPAAVVPLWDTPWHHSEWQERQRQVLNDPSLLGVNGHWCGPKGAASLATSFPSEPGETAWKGLVFPDGQGGYGFEGEGGRWPLITLEPELNIWLSQLERPQATTLVGRLNRFGPWLRASYQLS